MSGAGDTLDGLGILFVLFFLVVAFYLFFLPTFIARNRSSVSFGAIFVLNLLAGATGIFWLVALLWACFGEKRPPPEPPPTDQGAI